MGWTYILIVDGGLHIHFLFIFVNSSKIMLLEYCRSCMMAADQLFYSNAIV